MKPIFWLRTGIAAFLLVTGTHEIGHAIDPPAVTAPLNPLFLDFVASRGQASAKLLATPASGQRALGYIPSPVDYSYLKGQRITESPSAGQQPLRLYLPQLYDLRQQTKLTPVRDQGNCGDCWAFGAMGTLESGLMPGENHDFSENNLKDRNGFDWGHCSGGNGDMSTAYFTRWDGPVNESDDPYNVTSNVSPAGLPVQKHIQEVIIIPPRAGFLDNDAIKQALLDYGAVQSSVFVDDGASTYAPSIDFNPLYNAAYHSGVDSANHVIVIVGWDDTFDRNKFSTPPPGNGAFIIRNSWGTDWGENGYYYVSYYDTVVGNDNYQFRGIDPTTSYGRVYQYDPLGKIGSRGYGSDTAWFANIFTAAAQENISAAAFYTASVGSSYELSVYTGVGASPTSGTLAISTSGTIPAPGYHTVTFTPVALSSGQQFSIVVKLTTPGYDYPIPLEEPVPGYSSGATASVGQSFMSYAGTNWSDVAALYPNANVCLKAFAQYIPPVISALTVNMAGDGGGSVNSNPSGIACISGSCQASFNSDISVDLLAAPDNNSVFGGWSGDCSDTGDCTVSMTADRTVTATFALAPLLRIEGSESTSPLTLQSAYDTAPDNAVIQLKEGALTGSLVAGRSVDVAIKGGYDAAYTSNATFTSIQGTVLLRAGKVSVEKLNLR